MKRKKNRRAYAMGDHATNEMIRELMKTAKDLSEPDLIAELIVSALKIGQDPLDRGDIRLINMAVKELRYAMKVFEPYRHVRKAAIFGSARTKPESGEYRQARECARMIADRGWMVITGAASGIMSAGNEGAGRENSFGVNIRLPFEQEANPIILGDPKLINFKYFFTRKLIFVSESDATLLCPGGFGTHDEAFETLTLVQTGKATPRPIVCLDPKGSRYWKRWRDFIETQLAGNKMIDKNDLRLIDYTHDPEEAAEIITQYYSNYQSMRYIGDRLVLRIKKGLSKAAIGRLNREFSEICVKGKIEQLDSYFEEETNEPETLGFTRLSFYFDRRHFARLDQLIRRTNEYVKN